VADEGRRLGLTLTSWLERFEARLGWRAAMRAHHASIAIKQLDAFVKEHAYISD